MSLNQVIETTAEDDKLQRSTMSILDSSLQVLNMYGFIFDALWNTINRHCTDPQCKSLQNDESMDFDSYKIIRTDLMNAIKNSVSGTQWFKKRSFLSFYFNADGEYIKRYSQSG